jgi:serine/threonine protein phosphatase PrpC
MTATRTLGSAGIALSAGWLPKLVPAVEPNEDGALLAAGPGGLLLAVADGHGGSGAAVDALTALAVAAPSLLAANGHPSDAGLELVPATTTTSSVDVLRAFAWVARRAVVAAGVRAGAAAAIAPPCRTALSLVLVTSGDVLTTGYGDTAVAIAGAGRVRLLGRPSPFLGPDTSADPTSSAAQPVDCHRRRPGESVIIVSDGVLDFLGRAFQATVLEAVALGGGHCAAELVRRSGAAGAGDNITAAVLVDDRRPPWRTRLRGAARRW